MTLTIASANEIQPNEISCSSALKAKSAYNIVKACIGDKNVAAKKIIKGPTPI